MPFSANIYTPSGEEKDARKLTLSEHHKPFYCCTENCCAEMIPVNPGDANRGYFRSKKKLDHISSSCFKSSVTFDQSKYDESVFSLDFAFESMIGLSHQNPPINRGNRGTRQGHVGGGRLNRVRTIGVLYAMCRTLGKNATYNECSINDILADDENYSQYCTGINGYKLVETSYYYYLKNELAYIMNYPADYYGKNSWVKIKFENEKLFWKYYNKLIDSHHVEPIIIAGDWEQVNNPRYHSQCIIHSSRQIYWVT